MGKYKKYLYLDVKVPRSTISSRRKRTALTVTAVGTDRTHTNIAHQQLPSREDQDFQNPGPSTQQNAPVASGNHTNTVRQPLAKDNISLNPKTSNSINEVMDDSSQEENMTCPSSPDGYQNSTSESDEEIVTNTRFTCGQDSTDTSSSSNLGSSDEEYQDSNSVSSFDNSDIELDISDDDGVNQARCEDVQANPVIENLMCPCAKLTVDDMVVIVLSLGLRHNLSWVAQIDILNAFNAMYGENKVPSSKYLYLKKIEKKETKVSHHIICPNDTCELYLGEKSTFAEKITTCQHCGHSFDIQTVGSFFVTLSIEDQLREILKDKEIVKSLFTYRFNREKQNIENIEDIYDGDCYKALFKNGGILSNPHNFSYSFNTDGMPIGKSSRKTLWPIYVTINEMPHSDRDKYVLLAGLYIGNKDPDQSMFLEPFVEQANHLSSTGFIWDHAGAKITSLVLPLCAVVDSVARFQMLNMSSYVSYYGCTFCYIHNEYTRRGIRFTLKPERYEQRTPESTVRDIRETFNRRHETSERKRRYKGVKGPSPLMLLKHFNLIEGFIPDYMHAVTLAVIKTHMELLFESTRKKFWTGMNDRIAISHVISAIDEQLLCIAPPKIVTRLPRSMVARALWKASEWRAWLLFYCIPCLQNTLKRKYLSHLKLLSTAMFILLSSSISEASLKEAELLILRYVFLFEKYFGKENMVYNVHLLTHIVKGVRNWGPVWTHNCFLYEGQNRYILQMFQSPNQVLKQLVRKFLTFGSLPSLISKTATTEKGVDFCESILNKQLKFFVNVGEVLLLKRTFGYRLTEEEENVIFGSGMLNENNVEFYEALIFKRCRLTTSKFARGKKNNNSFVFLQENRFGQIEQIIRDNEQNKVCLVVRVIKTKRNPVSFDDDFIQGTFTHIFEVEKMKHLILTTLRSIIDVCVYSGGRNGAYICTVPYGSRGNF